MTVPAPSILLSCMAEYVVVKVYCPNPRCDFRGSLDAHSYVMDAQARSCPDCGATPLRIEVPGGPVTVPAGFAARE